MNTLFRVRIISAVIVFTLLSFSVEAAQYYVVIGAFAKESNARKFTGYARNLYLEASYKFNPERNLYYVHVMKTSLKDEARKWTLYLKHEIGFKDAWICTDLPGEQNSFIPEDVTTKQRQPRYSRNENFMLSSNGPIASAKWSEKISTSENLEKSEANNWEAAWTSNDEISYISNIKNIINVKENIRLASGKLFTFVVETSERKTIPAEVMLVNYEKARKISSFKTGEYVAFRGKRRNQLLTVVCDVFGYSQETRTLNLDNPTAARDIKQNQEGVWEVRFKLKMMEKNEISVMYNTVFYQDAAVLQPSSKKQVDELLSLMKSHPEYEILIHSHCNRGSKRDIKLPGKNKSYFDIQDSLEKTASDKQLTKQRAETIRSYLVDNGIGGKRISIFGWGSMDMLVESTSPDAAINDCIEIELLEDK